MQRAKYSRTFRTIYNAPPCSNIFGRINVCVLGIATIFTAKMFSVSNSDVIATYEGGLTCMISAMSNFQDELKKFEDKEAERKIDNLTSL